MTVVFTGADYYLRPTLEFYAPNLVGELKLDVSSLMEYAKSLSTQAAVRLELYNRYTNLSGKPILSRTITTATGSAATVNNKCACPFECILTDTKVGYMFGEPVSINIDGFDSSKQIDGLLDDKLREYKKSARFVQTTYEAGKLASICGFASKLLYINQRGEVESKVYSPWQTFFLGSSIERPDIGIIYYYRDVYENSVKARRMVLEVYTDSEHISYQETKTGYIEALRERNVFGRCPLIGYANNLEMQGDFEKVLAIIDAYDTVISDAVNDAEKVARSILAISGMVEQGSTEEEKHAWRDRLKNAGILLLAEGGEAQFLTKTLDSAFFIALQQTLRGLIFDLSGIPDFTDASFFNAQSGYAIRLKMTGFENKCVQTEMSFRNAIERELDVVNGLPTWSEDISRVSLEFKRNLPADMVSTLSVMMNAWGSGFLSHSTALNLSQVISDPQGEIEKIKLEKEVDYIGDAEMTEEVQVGQESEE